MFFIIKLMLIILLNQTSAHITQDVETTILPAWKPTRRNEILLTLKAFGKQIYLKLCKNDKTASSAFRKHDEKYRTKEEPQLNSTNSCYYYHNDYISSAIINICHQYGWEGIILLENDTLQIRPLQDHFTSLTLTDNSCIKKETNISFGKLHLIIRSLQPFANSNFHNIKLDNLKLKRHVQDTPKKLTIKLAVFVDKTAYHTFMPILDEDEEKFHNMMLAYVNNIQALFHHSSLDTPIDIPLVHLEIMDTNIYDFTIFRTEIEQLLRSFCVYADAYNRPVGNQNRWDLALYLTGLNVYKLLPNYLKRLHDVGVSYQDSICTTDSCAVIEFGVDDVITSGFASSIIAAHEIGHILGMRHDEDMGLPLCKDNYIMTTIRKNRGQVTWSECSRIIAKQLWNTKQCLRDRTTSESIDYSFPKYDHYSRYHNLPGRDWNAKAQCEIFFHSKNAKVVSLSDVCEVLICEIANKPWADTGPPLEGTYCDPFIDKFGHKHECRGGECVPITQPSYISKYNETNNWSEQDTHKNLTIRLAVFVDEAVYRTFMPILDEDKEKVQNMIFAYVNNIQALFHHPSLGAPIDISLVHLAIMDKKLDIQIPYDNYRDALWNAFCEYANANNRPESAPDHWDLALYLTKIDIYTIDHSININHIASSVHETICTNKSCAIVEFGVDDYITSGFASSVVAAHEIGYILGMQHDEGVDPYLCKTKNYIMSSTRTARGQVTWSECSRYVAQELWDKKECLRDHRTPESIFYIFPPYDHSRYDDLPGREWNAKAQCEVYFHSKDANVVSLLDMCQSLECEAPNQAKAFTGPALEGTYCDPYINRFGHKKECRGGECVPITQPPYNHKHFETDNWSEWKIDSCQSSCLENSQGVTVKRRFCTHETKRTANCKGSYYDVVLCNDSLICANKSRQTVSNFTEMKCTEINSLTKNIVADRPFEIPKVPGLQDYYDVEKPWIACIIFCRHTENSYLPSLEMIQFNKDPYFPDGTWCHHKDGQDYYCRQHYCLPF